MLDVTWSLALNHATVVSLSFCRGDPFSAPLMQWLQNGSCCIQGEVVEISSKGTIIPLSQGHLPQHSRKSLLGPALAKYFTQVFMDLHYRRGSRRSFRTLHSQTRSISLPIQNSVLQWLSNSQGEQLCVRGKKKAVTLSSRLHVSLWRGAWHYWTPAWSRLAEDLLSCRGNESCNHNQLLVCDFKTWSGSQSHLLLFHNMGCSVEASAGAPCTSRKLLQAGVSPGKPSIVMRSCKRCCLPPFQSLKRANPRAFWLWCCSAQFQNHCCIGNTEGLETELYSFHKYIKATSSPPHLESTQFTLCVYFPYWMI